jgi:tRNA-binding protein
MMGMDTIGWTDFDKVELRVGTITRAEPFPETRHPAYKVWADFGAELGELKSSAQITVHYQPEDLVGRQILGVVNFPPKQVGPFMSEFLLTGFYDANNAVVLAIPERPIPNGCKLG